MTDGTLIDSGGKNGGKNGGKELTERQQVIVSMIREFGGKNGGKSGGLKVENIVAKTKVGRRTIERELALLRKQGLIRRLEGRQKGYYVIVE